MLLQKEGGSHYTVRDSAKWNNQLRPGNIFYSGVRLWKPVLYFDIPWSSPRPYEAILPLSEFYFETPITVNDTFWVGIKNCDIISYRSHLGTITGIGGPGFQSDTTDYLYMYNHFYDNILVLNGNMEKDTSSPMRRTACSATRCRGSIWRVRGWGTPPSRGTPTGTARRSS